MAQALDEHYKGKKKPPLFGMPFSVKENFCVSKTFYFSTLLFAFRSLFSFQLIDYECSRGLAKELEWPMKEECSLISHLRSVGAVPLVRTNVPQTLLSFTCSNPAFGATLHPLDSTRYGRPFGNLLGCIHAFFYHSRTPGGSSGGEACLIATGGCPFGTGSDVGGSMRIPAHFCGITTLKPTSGT